MSDQSPAAPIPDPDSPTPPPPAPPSYGNAPTYGAAPGYDAPPAYGAPTPPAYDAPPAYGAAPNYGTAAAYGAPPTYGSAPVYGYGAPAKTNTLAIVSLVASIAAFVILPFIGSVVGVITGHIALGQIKRTGEQGRGLALGGTIAGWVGLGLTILGVILAIMFFSFFATMGPYTYSYSS